MAPPPESPGQPDRYRSAGYLERAVTIDCEGEAMFGIASLPASPASRAVLVIVGGPQYRAGSHRQFTLLARHLAERGTPVLRFDYRGMGDSHGAARDFERAGPDIARAVDCLAQLAGDGAEIVLWGLCDGASAALFYAPTDPRVAAVALLNPWVRTSEGLARATLRHYYLSRLVQRSFWAKLLGGRFELANSARSLASLASAAARGGGAAMPTSAPLPVRMLASLQQFRGRVLVLLSGQDLTAREFSDATSSRPWRRALQSDRVRRHVLDGADHTFSRREWRDEVARLTDEWVRSW